MNEKEWRDYMDSIDENTYEYGDYDDVRESHAKIRVSKIIQINKQRKRKGEYYESDDQIIDQQS